MKLRPDKPGKQFNPHSNNPDKNPLPVYQGQPIASSNKQEKKAEIDDSEEDKNTVKKEYVSDEFLQCRDEKEKKNKKNVDEHMLQVNKSCQDLAIDG